MTIEELEDYVSLTMAKLDYIESKQPKIRKALDNYNIRVAKQLAFYAGWDYESVLAVINLMPDNK